MNALRPAPIDKQVFLKFYGSFEQQDLTVELAIFNPDIKSPLITVLGKLAANALLAHQVTHHWQQAYRPLFHGRGIKPISIKAENISLKSCQQSAQNLKASFNTWLTDPGFQTIRETLLRELNPTDQIQILLQTGDRTLQQLPWSEWRLLQNYPHAAINLSALEAGQPQPQRSRHRLRILGILGASENIATSTDQKLLESLPHQQVEIKILNQPNRTQLSDELWEQAWDMILFAGHGETTATGQGLLYLNDAGETLSLNEIWYGLRKAVNAGLQLAIFNSCAGLGLLARNLQEDVQIPQMIVMRDVVPDVVAQHFLRYFLTAFAQGTPLYLAAKQARERLQGLENQYPCASWLPIIWQNPYIPSLALRPPPQSRFVHFKASRPRWKLISLLGVTVLGALMLRSPLAQILNLQGKAAYQRNQLLLAQRYFQGAEMLQPGYAEPRYNLAWLLDEKWGQTQKAEQQYYEAALLGLPEAIAEYVRLRLLTPNLSEAEYSSLYKLTQRCLEQDPLLATQASCLKNRGWIRLQQQRWPKAQTDLQAALALRNDSPHTHCLIAQVFEATEQTEAAQSHWRETLKYSQDHVHEQDRCLRWAEQRLTP
ncbi:MAG: CHAT domain-containing protein [Spirulina sp. SIO3F2]|nr:CHAT domain-containing protein [Spirulina sp. SIO3F2]